MPKRPPNDELIFADFNAEWLNTPSPFDELDEDWIKIIIFFVFHVPVQGVSARGKSLSLYHWGEKSKTNDFKTLRSRLIKYAGMESDQFKSIQNWEDMKPALRDNDLLNFPNSFQNVRITYRKDKDGICESLCNHIRNSFAHGRLVFKEVDGNTFIALEDIDDKKTVTARMILSKDVLLRWIKIITSGPFASTEELDQFFGLNEIDDAL